MSLIGDLLSAYAIEAALLGMIVTAGKLGLPVDCAPDLAWTQLP